MQESSGADGYKATRYLSPQKAAAKLVLRRLYPKTERRLSDGFRINRYFASNKYTQLILLVGYHPADETGNDPIIPPPH